MSVLSSRTLPLWATAIGWLASPAALGAEEADLPSFLADHCYGCHGESAEEADLNLQTLSREFDDREVYRIWVRVHDRIVAGEMPPEGEPRPDRARSEAVTARLSEELLAAGRRLQRENGRAPLRRLTRSEYEHTIHDLLHLEGAALKQLLPDDGTAHDTDKHADALDLSYVQLRQYMAAAERAMDLAIATFPTAPEVKVHRAWPQQFYSMARLRRGVQLLITDDKQRDPRVPLPAKPLDKPVINKLDLRGDDSPEARRSVGELLNAEDVWKFGASLPGRYRVRASFWSFAYEQGKLEPAEQPQMAAILAEDERGETELVYADAPSLEGRVTEVVTWLNPQNRVGWRPAILSPAPRNLGGIPKKAQGYRGAGVAVDWIELEGPLFDRWPPASHRRLFGDLPLEPLSPDAGVTLPDRPKLNSPRHLHPAIPDVPVPGSPGERMSLREAQRTFGPFTPTTSTPLQDAERLLGDFLPRAFRRPVPKEEVAKYVDVVEARLGDGDCFENAMRTAYQTALCSYSFLYRAERPGELDDHALATRLSYFLWNSTPDDELLELADGGRLREPGVLRQQVDRMLADPKSDRFVADFLDQWLDLDEIDATTPDEKLYPEFQPFMSDLMVAETRGYFREMIERNRPVDEVIDSDWGTLNQVAAELYGIDGVDGATSRHVALPADGLRGGLITQASVLKVTADGTSTSPVRRGVFLLEKILGVPPTPPPPNVGNVDPDVRGATTVRELLAKHRDDASCATCHAEIDPPGFALESFDPIGMSRDRYRGTEIGDDPELVYPNMRRAEWLLGPPVDSSGVTADGEPFENVEGFRESLKRPEHRELVARNLMERMIVYATGSEVGFADRPVVDAMMQQWSRKGHGVRDLIDLLVQSEIFLHK